MDMEQGSLTPAPVLEVFGDILKFWQRRFSGLVAALTDRTTLSCAECAQHGQTLLDICRDKEADGSLCVARSKSIVNNDDRECVTGTVLDVRPEAEGYSLVREHSRNVGTVGKMWIRQGEGKPLPWHLCGLLCAHAAECPSYAARELNPVDCLTPLRVIDKDVIGPDGLLEETITKVSKGKIEWKR